MTSRNSGTRTDVVRIGHSQPPGCEEVERKRKSRVEIRYSPERTNLSIFVPSNSSDVVVAVSRFDRGDNYHARLGMAV
jgi:hypothetical protein